MTTPYQRPPGLPTSRVRLAILQPTSLCNLNCSYCYVPDRTDSSLMTDEVVRAGADFVYAIAPPDQTTFTFLWHAGEPLAAGLDFYRRAFPIVQDAAAPDHTIRHSMQTNATLITQQWCDFFREHTIDFGVSIDGPRHLHDSSRRNWAGRGSFTRAMKGVSLLRGSGFNPSAICVLTPASLDEPDAIYDFFLDNRFPSVGFNFEESEGAHARSRHLDSTEATVRQKYTRFMEHIWQRWRTDQGRLRIREFERELTSILQFQRDPAFVATPDEAIPFVNIAIRRDGGISTFSPELASTASAEYADFVIGNVLTDTPATVAASPALRRLHADVELGRTACKHRCAYYALCGGGFQSNRYAEHGTLTATRTSTCQVQRIALTDMVVTKLATISAQQDLLLAATSRSDDAT